MKIFISYRRKDTGELAFQLCERLQSTYGERAVFLDVSAILPERDFEERIGEIIAECDLVLAIIGKRWLNAADAHGRKLDNPEDLLRKELELALTTNALVLPVLIENTPMPRADDLPEGLKKLPRMQACRLGTGADFERSVVALRERMESLVAGKKQDARAAAHPVRGYVLAVGGGNGEYTLTPSSPYREGGKHQVRSRPLYGGSGVNYAAKLMGYGIPAVPIVSVGDDELGKEIRAELLRLCADAALPSQLGDWVGSNHFLVPNARTPRSTIVVEGGRRTIFKETVAREERGDFMGHLERSFEILKARGILDRVKAVVIGHIQADEPVAGEPPGPGPCTRYIVDYFHGRQVPLFANFGDSQLRRGHEAWRSVLEKLEVFQLNADELLQFFGPGLELDAIVQDDRVRRSMYCVVTMDKFGALCVGTRERINGLIVAWSSKQRKVVDTTGAGDAFLSGVVSYAYEFPEELRRHQGILQPMARGRVWAEFTCQHLGGASETPDAARLRVFETSLPNGYVEPNVVDEAHAKTILSILGTAFDEQAPPSP